jgi:hypothetical protein
MTVPKEAWPFLGAICAAVIGGTVSFVVTMLSKEQKTSEFRQAWIDGLREDLANFAGISALLADIVDSRMARGETLESIEGAVVSSHLADIQEIEVARLKILFRLNPVEHATLIERIDAMFEHSAIEEFENPGSGERLISDFVAESQKVLKSEWKRVKRGEITFRMTKWISLLFVTVSIVCGLAYVIHTVAGSHPSQPSHRSEQQQSN